MLQVNFLKEHRDRVLEGLKKRNFKDLELVDSAISLDDERREKRRSRKRKAKNRSV